MENEDQKPQEAIEAIDEGSEGGTTELDVMVDELVAYHNGSDIKLDGGDGNETIITILDEDKKEIVSGTLNELYQTMTKAKDEALNETDAQNDPSFLLGSSAHPSHFVLKDGTVLTLGDVVRSALEKTGFENKQWNELSEEDREALIQLDVDLLELADDQTLPQAPETAPVSNKPKAEEFIAPETLKIRWIPFDRRKVLRVIKDFEFGDVFYEAGEIFDWAPLGIKPYFVNKLYNRKVVRHVVQDSRVSYPFRNREAVQPQIVDDKGADDEAKKLAKKSADELKAEKEAIKEAKKLAKFTRKNAHKK